jgi:hypothetical protein
MVENYTVVLGRDIPELITKVNAIIRMGWQPQGSIAFDQHKLVYMQAMWTNMKNL